MQTFKKYICQNFVYVYLSMIFSQNLLGVFIGCLLLTSFNCNRLNIAFHNGSWSAIFQVGPSCI